MPFDLVKELKDTLTRHAEAQVTRVLAQRGQIPGPRLTGQRDSLGATGSVESDATFVTGYDGTDTVSAFMLDYSALDGPDVLTG